MKVLIAEDDAVSRRLLEATLQKWGYQVTVTTDGIAACAALEADAAPTLAILDWMMPGLDGLEVCRRLRGQDRTVYLILLTTKGKSEDVVAGLDAGADDYLTKPFDREELRARLRVGARVVQMQQTLAERVRDLEEALSRVKQLQGLLPICAWCKNVRDDHDYWQTVEEYVSSHSDARFTHGICPNCLQRQMGDVQKARDFLAERPSIPKPPPTSEPGTTKV